MPLAFSGGQNLQNGKWDHFAVPLSIMALIITLHCTSLPLPSEHIYGQYNAAVHIFLLSLTEHMHYEDLIQYPFRTIKLEESTDSYI